MAAVVPPVQPLPARAVALADALGCVVAENVVSPLDLPVWDNSAMDGYAVRVSDLKAGAGLKIGQKIMAGAVGTRLEPGCAARIFTGAPIPSGADAVVMQEQRSEEHTSELSHRT